MQNKIEFYKWYEQLRMIMGKRTGIEDELPLDPDTYCDIETWKQYYENGLSPEEAFRAEC